MKRTKLTEIYVTASGGTRLEGAGVAQGEYDDHGAHRPDARSHGADVCTNPPKTTFDY